MKLVDRYIIKNVSLSLALVLFSVTGLQVFLLFVSQLGDIGKADFGMLSAFIFVMMQLPSQIYIFFPIVSLLGCLIGLSVMGGHHELVVLRAAGMSIGQITVAIFKMAILLILGMSLLGELVVPKIFFWSNEYKNQMLRGGQSLQTAKGVWLHTDQDILMIGNIVSLHNLKEIEQFHFDQDRNLIFVRRIQELKQNEGQWRATFWEQTNLMLPKTTVEQARDVPWDVALDPRLLHVWQYEANEMTFPELHQFLKVQKLTKQNFRNYELGYWQRLISPFTTLVMMLLAIPFVFGPLRSSSMGIKLICGATVGFSFYIIDHFCGALSQIYQFPSFWAAIGPTTICAAAGIFLMYKK